MGRHLPSLDDQLFPWKSSRPDLVRLGVSRCVMTAWEDLARKDAQGEVPVRGFGTRALPTLVRIRVWKRVWALRLLCKDQTRTEVRQVACLGHPTGL